MVPWFDLQCVIVVFPDHIFLLFLNDLSFVNLQKLELFKDNVTLRMLDFLKYHQGVKQGVKQHGSRFVGPDLGPNCLKRLSADDKSRRYWATSLIQNNFLVILSWLKPTFSIWLKCWLQQILGQGKP